MIANTNESWGLPARALHWLIALLLFVQIGLGLIVEEVPEHLESTYLGLHASVGASILALMIIRLGWRVFNQAPAQPAGTPRWQESLAHLVHWGLYLITFATIIAGWMLMGSEREPLPILVFGLFPLPQLVASGSPYHDLLGEVHETLAFTLVALIIVHVAAALYHQVILRDNVLRRMTSGAGSAKA